MPYTEEERQQIEDLALFMATRRQQGKAPIWYVAIEVAQIVNCSVWQIALICGVEDDYSNMDALVMEWVRRAMVVMEAQRKAEMMMLGGQLAGNMCAICGVNPAITTQGTCAGCAKLSNRIAG